MLRRLTSLPVSLGEERAAPSRSSFIIEEV